jgi:hypothetical protein
MDFHWKTISVKVYFVLHVGSGIVNALGMYDTAFSNMFLIEDIILIAIY